MNLKVCKIAVLISAIVSILTGFAYLVFKFMIPGLAPLALGTLMLSLYFKEKILFGKKINKYAFLFAAVINFIVAVLQYKTYA